MRFYVTKVVVFVCESSNIEFDTTSIPDIEIDRIDDLVLSNIFFDHEKEV